MPKQYIKTITELEDHMNEALSKEKGTAKKMNATNARALNSIKQRLKRNNRQYETEIERYKADPEAFMLEEEVEAEEQPRKRSARSDGDVLTTIEDDDGFATVTRGGRTVHLTTESIFKHLKVIIEARGKKNTDRIDQIRTMEKLYDLAQTPYQKIKVLQALISTRYDLSIGVLSYMATEQWKWYADLIIYALLISQVLMKITVPSRRSIHFYKSLRRTRPGLSSRAVTSGKMKTKHLQIQPQVKY
jgi:translation initiation factor 3 subunit C